MTKITKTLLVLICLIGLLSAQEKTTALKDAPSFSLNDVSGKLVVLDSLIKKGPVIMSFWALWCKMCVKELDALKTYYPEIESLGVNFLAISLDRAKSKNEVKSFAAGHKWKYRVVLDPENKLRKSYNVQVMPSLFIVDQNKKIVFTHQGYKPGDEKKIMEKVRELVKKCKECKGCGDKK